MSILNNEELQLELVKNRDKKNLILNWIKADLALKDFQNKATLKTFNNLFKEEGERLWKHYVKDCDYKYQALMTYLTAGQKMEVLYNTVYNPIIVHM